MLITYAVLAVLAVVGLVWAVNQHVPQILGGPGSGL
jgi:hypothetical protein